MVTRLPWTLWAQIFVELWKLVLLTTAVLVSVIAFAAAIKPLADGKLDPIDTFKFMTLAMVPMLQYALPFSACFGATLAYHRLSADNELTAVYAGGVSHRAMLVPAIVSGVLLSLILLVLSHLMIPQMLRQMAELVTANAARIIESQIERGEPIEFGRTLVSADQVRRPETVAPGFSDALWLGGLLVVTTDEKGEVVSHGSASSASVWIRPAASGSTGAAGGVAGRASTGGRPDQRLTEVIIQPTDAVGRGEGMVLAAGGTSRSFFLPNSMRDNPKFCSFTELAELRRTPERIDYINRARSELAMKLAEREGLERMRRMIRETGVVELRGPFKERVVLKAAQVRPVKTDGKVNLRTIEVMPLKKDGSVTVERMVDGKSQVQRAASALISARERTDGEAGSVYTITLREVVAETISAEGELVLSEAELRQQEPVRFGEQAIGVARSGEARERPISDLRLEDDPAPALLELSWRALVSRAEERSEQKPIEKDSLVPSVEQLRLKVDDLVREVLSKEHERYAQCLACLVMVIVGATMAMRLRDALPLTIYLWAFFPALATVLAISGGQQLTHGQGPVGLSVMYSGVMVLSVLAMVEFIRLRKH
jgi:lipopolysaccharide export system permease protein